MSKKLGQTQQMTFINQTTGRSMTLERMEAEGESQLLNKVPGESFKFMIISPERKLW